MWRQNSEKKAKSSATFYVLRKAAGDLNLTRISRAEVAQVSNLCTPKAFGPGRRFPIGRAGGGSGRVGRLERPAGWKPCDTAGWKPVLQRAARSKMRVRCSQPPRSPPFAPLPPVTSILQLC